MPTIINLVRLRFEVKRPNIMKAKHGQLVLTIKRQSGKPGCSTSWQAWTAKGGHQDGSLQRSNGSEHGQGHRVVNAFQSPVRRQNQRNHQTEIRLI